MAPQDPPIPGPQDVADYLKNLQSLMSNPLLSQQASTYLQGAGLQTRSVGLGDRDWQNMQHDQIRDNAAHLYAGNHMPGGVEDIDKANKAIKAAADSVEHHFETFDRAIAAATALMWHGKSGQAAADAISKYVRDSYRLVEAGYATSTQFDSLYHSMTATWQQLPDKPRPYMAGLRDVVEFWDWGSDTNVQSRADTAASGEAIRVMNSVYYGDDAGAGVSGTGITQVSKSLPVMPAAQSPVNNDKPGDQNSPYTDPSGHGGGVPNADAPGEPAPGSPNNPADPNAPGSQDKSTSGTDSGQGHNGSGNGSANGNNGAQNGVTASAADPTGGLGSGGLGGGLGAGGSGAGDLTAPTLGGGAGVTGVGPTAVRSGAGSAGRAGSPGMGAPGGGKGKKEEDKEHKTATYLYGQHLQDWLYGNIDKLSPPVIGVWDEKSKSEQE